MLNYRFRPSDRLARLIGADQGAQLVLDTDAAGRRDAFNPVELLLAALARLHHQGVERAIPALKFELRHSDVIVEGERPDNSPKLVAIHYDVVIDTDEPDRRLSLLQVNIENTEPS